MAKPLILTPQAVRGIDAVVSAAGVRECFGLLASKPGAVPVTTIEVLPAHASCASADAPPMALKRAADALATRGLVARGIWHSHGRMPVFHSGIDVATIHRLLPAMAAGNCQRGSVMHAPAVEGPDSAVLPLDDGRVRIFALRSQPIPDTDLCEPAAWTSITVDWDRDCSRRSATLSSSHVCLSAGGVVLSLGVPSGATVETRVADRAFARIARLYSLVVNTNRDRYAQCLVVADVGGESFTRLADCEVVVEGDAAADTDLEAHGGDPCLRTLLAIVG